MRANMTYEVPEPPRLPCSNGRKGKRQDPIPTVLGCLPHNTRNSSRTTSWPILSVLILPIWGVRARACVCVIQEPSTGPSGSVIVVSRAGLDHTRIQSFPGCGPRDRTERRRVLPKRRARDSRPSSRENNSSSAPFVCVYVVK